MLFFFFYHFKIKFTAVNFMIRHQVFHHRCDLTVYYVRENKKNSSNLNG